MAGRDLEKGREYAREYRRKNREMLLKKKRKYREENKEKIKKYREGKKEYFKEYQERNKEKLKEYARNYRAKNKEKIRENGRKYNENNREKRRAYKKEYYIKEKMNYEEKKEGINKRRRERYRENIEEERKKRREYMKKIPFKVRCYGYTRRARACGKPLGRRTMTKAIEEGVMIRLKEQDYKCLYCGIDIKDTFTLDHIIPLSRGGGNTIENIDLVCRSCNTSKGTRTKEEYLEVLEKRTLEKVAIAR